MPSRTAQLVSYKAASELVGKAAVLALLFLAARALPLAEFGVVSVATTLGWIASVASDFGLQLYLSRSIARSSAPGEVLWPLFVIRIRTAAVALGVIMAISWPLAPAGTFIAFVLIAAGPLISSVTEFLSYGYRGLGRSELESAVTVVQRLGALVLVTVGLALSPTLLTVGLVLTGSALAALATSVVIAQRIFPASLPNVPTSPLPHLSLWPQVAPIGAGLVLSALYFRIDVFLLERWSGLEPVAHYSAVFRLVDAMRLLPAVVLAVMLPRLFGARDAGFARRLAINLTGFAMAVTLAAWPLAPWLVSLAYGPAYREAAPIFQVLLLSFPLLTLNYSLTHQLIGWDQSKAYALCCAAALVANLALNAWLIPQFGAIGAAWATLGTEVVVSVFCLAALQRPQISAYT